MCFFRRFVLCVVKCSSVVGLTLLEPELELLHPEILSQEAPYLFCLKKSFDITKLYICDHSGTYFVCMSFFFFRLWVNPPSFHSKVLWSAWIMGKSITIRNEDSSFCGLHFSPLLKLLPPHILLTLTL